MQTIESALTSAIDKACEAGWNLNQIALASGVPQPTLQNWWTGARSLHLVNVERLAAHFGMKLSKPRKNTGAPKG